MDAIFLNGDTVLLWSDFVNAATGSPVTTAAVTGTLSDLDGSQISTCTLTYDTDIAAYTGSISTVGSTGNSLVTEGLEYFLTVTAVLGSTRSTRLALWGNEHIPTALRCDTHTSVECGPQFDLSGERRQDLQFAVERRQVLLSRYAESLVARNRLPLVQLRKLSRTADRLRIDERLRFDHMTEVRLRDDFRRIDRRRLARAWLDEHPMCCECLNNGCSTVASVVDHVVPHRGNDRLFWDRSNWQSLCVSCHNTKTRRENQEIA